jgi:hypothetical protein
MQQSLFLFDYMPNIHILALCRGDHSSWQQTNPAESTA